MQQTKIIEGTLIDEEIKKFCEKKEIEIVSIVPLAFSEAFAARHRISKVLIVYKIDLSI